MNLMRQIPYNVWLYSRIIIKKHNDALNYVHRVHYHKQLKSENIFFVESLEAHRLIFMSGS